MGFNVNDKTITSRLNRFLAKARNKEAASLAKLASGQRFIPGDAKPAERAIAETMEFRIRSLSAAKKNISDASSLLETAESAMGSINNIVTRMKEINIAAASTTVSDQERRYLFVEYEALFDEINRIALTTEYNGIPVLNGDSDKVPEELVFRVDDPFFGDDDLDLNTIKLEDLKSVVATTEGLGLKSARDLLEDSAEGNGIPLGEIEELLLPEESDRFATAYDQATTILSTHRATFGALQSRLEKAKEFNDVYQENIEAAKSKIADTDYAQEVANLLQAKIQSNAATSLLAQSNITAKQTMQLFNSII